MKQVTIIAECPRGHETFMFPDKCVSVTPSYGIGGSLNYAKASVAWECPNCPRDDYKHEVEL